ncbi:MAG: hypothetical protein GX254_03120 [Clostridiales bacterium]|jgi:hypothetical protein|nr:hypothetical protein [Clostridiales bacterium]
MTKNKPFSQIKAACLAAILLVAMLLTGFLSGCRQRGEQMPSPTASQTVSETTPSGTSGLRDDTLVFTVDGRPVYWDELNYWLFSALQYIGKDPGGNIDWTETYEGLPLSEYIMSEALEAVRMYKTVEAKCEELSVVLSEEDKANIASVRDSGIAQLGSEEEYLDFLKENKLNEKLIEYIYSVSYLHNNLFVEMFGENGSKVSDEDAIAFGEENGYCRAKHILIKTVDETGNPLSQNQLEKNRERLQGILEDIKAAPDAQARFDQLMNESSEDPGKEAFPDGYQFDADTINFDKSFLKEATSLQAGGISQDIIEMEGMGYTILMRLPLDPDLTMVDSGTSLRSMSAATRFQTLLESWAQEREIAYEDVFYTIKPENLFGIQEA